MAKKMIKVDLADLFKDGGPDKKFSEKMAKVLEDMNKSLEQFAEACGKLGKSQLHERFKATWPKMPKPTPVPVAQKSTTKDIKALSKPCSICNSVVYIKEYLDPTTGGSMYTIYCSHQRCEANQYQKHYFSVYDATFHWYHDLLKHDERKAEEANKGSFNNVGEVDPDVPDWE